MHLAENVRKKSNREGGAMDFVNNPGMELVDACLVVQPA